MRVEVDLLKCESNGMCAAAAPGVFELSDDDELTVLVSEVPASELAAVENAVRMCPKQALTLVAD